MANPAVTYTFSNGSTADATQVNQNYSDIINALTDGTKNLTISALTAGGAASLNGAVTLGTSTANDLTINCALAADIPIKTNTTYNIGSATKGLLGVYLGGTSTFSIKLVAATMSASYTMTMPAAVPASQAVLQMSTAGAVTAVVPKAPTIQTFTSGTGTYTTPANVIYLKVKMVGPGGGGGAVATNLGAGGSVATTFGTSLLSAGLGAGGGTGGGVGGTGGAASITAPAIGVAFTGTQGGDGTANSGSTTISPSGYGGSSVFGGGAGSVVNDNGRNAATNSGSGGSGGAGTNNQNMAAGGGSGGYVEAIVPSPSATYAYVVGAGGAGGAAGTKAGGNGAAGIIVVTEHYQ